MLKKLNSLMENEGNYKNYRRALANTTPPSLPYLGTALTDLIFIEDGNADYVGDLINFKKRDLLTETISIIQQFQQTPFAFEIKEPVYTFLQELPFLEDKELWEISSFIEPKDKEKK